jgi:hypothetical protein
MPAKLAETLGLTDSVRAIPIVEPAATHAVGLVVPHREPMTPLISALVAEARALAKVLEQPVAPAKNDADATTIGETKKRRKFTKRSPSNDRKR